MKSASHTSSIMDEVTNTLISLISNYGYKLWSLCARIKWLWFLESCCRMFQSPISVLNLLRKVQPINIFTHFIQLSQLKAYLQNTKYSTHGKQRGIFIHTDDIFLYKRSPSAVQLFPQYICSICKIQTVQVLQFTRFPNSQKQFSLNW